MITLSEYLGYIFKEISTARKMADDYSVEIAKSYAQHELLKHFAVPRFKIPSLELKIPVVISGAKFTQTKKLNINKESFTSFIRSELQKAEQSVLLKKNGSSPSTISSFSINRPPIKINPVIPIRSKSSRELEKVVALIEKFYLICSNTEAFDNLENECKINCSQIFMAFVEERKLAEDFKNSDPNNSIFELFKINTQKKIQENIIVVENNIKNLLVDPETEKVKLQGQMSDIAIFQIHTTIVEDGFFVQSIKDEKNNITQVINFE